MANKPNYKELEDKIRRLESELAKFKNMERESTPGLSEDFKRLADRSQDAIYHYDIASRKFIFFNTLFLELFGLEVDYGKLPTPKSVLLHIHSEDREKVKKAMANSLAPTCGGGEVEYRFQHPNGSIRWMHDRWTVIRDTEGQPSAIEGFIRDNTERKQIEDELESIRRNALIGTYIAQDNKFQYINLEFMRITGYNEAELLGMNPLELVHSDYRNDVRAKAVNMLKGIHSSPYEFCIEDKFGEEKWIMETVTPIRFKGRQAVLGNFMDITKSKRSEEELRKKEKLQAVLEMAGAVCHELNNPMQVVLSGCKKLIMDSPENNKQDKELYSFIKESIDRIAKITSNLQRITKYTTKDYVSGKKIIDINEASKE